MTSGLGYDWIISTEDGYSIGYNGGRLADVLIMGVTVEVVPVRALDGSMFGPQPTQDEIRAKVREFVNPEDMDNYRETARAFVNASVQ